MRFSRANVAHDPRTQHHSFTNPGEEFNLGEWSLGGVPAQHLERLAGVAEQHVHLKRQGNTRVTAGGTGDGGGGGAAQRAGQNTRRRPTRQ